MRARGLVECRDTRAGELTLTHKEDVEGFAAGDQLYTQADVPELVALELKRRGKTSAVEGPFVLTREERLARGAAADGHVDEATMLTLTAALDRAARTLGPQPGGETVHRIADLLGFVNRADGMSGYEQISDEKLIEEVRRTNQRCIELDEQILAWQNAHCIEADFEDESKHPLGHALDRKLALVVEPLSDFLREMAENHVRNTTGDASTLAVELLRRCPKPTPKPLHRVAFEAALAAGKQHAVDSDEYWQEITAAVLAADKAGAK